MPYQVYIGLNQAANLADMAPQPRTVDPIDAGEVIWASDGSLVPVGADTLELQWTAISNSERSALLTAFGLSETTRTAAVTIRLKINAGTFANYNCWATYLKTERRVYTGWVDFRIRVEIIVAL